jgi:exodeoxyribonuclease-5
MEKFKFSKDQSYALDAILNWYSSVDNKAFAFGGAAGTGKSTIISHIKQYLPMREIVYCAYTGKATTVLRRKLTEQGIGGDSVSTIHGLMYDPVIDSQTKEVVGWDKKQRIGADLIVVDEASMVPADIFDDLVSYNIPILFVGDHYQLPPVSEYDFNLMETPDVKLEKPHRFAENSPIIQLSTRIRNRDTVKYGVHGDNVIKRRMKNITPKERELFFQSDEVKTGDAIIICGFNKTRTELNNKIRAHFGYRGLINDDERIICLRNNKKTNIPLFNGSIGTVSYASNKRDTLRLSVTV